MSDDSNQSDAELDLDSGNSEGDAGAASTTSDNTNKVNGEGEESATLELNSDKESKAKEGNSTSAYNKQKQVEAWADRYYNNEVDLEQIPKWIQQEIQNAEKPSESLDEAVDRKLSEKESHKEFVSLQQSLNKRGLTKSEVKEITSEYTELRENGVPEHIALKKAVKLSGIDLEAKAQIDEEKEEKRRSMQIPPNTGGVKEENFDENLPYSEIQKRTSKETRMKHLEALRDRQLKA